MAVRWAGGWGSRKDVGHVGLGKRQAEKPNGTFPVRACVRMRMLSIYLFNQFSTLIVVLSFGPSVKSTLGRPHKRSGFPAVNSALPVRSGRLCLRAVFERSWEKRVAARSR